jgi:hypothetical protein
VTIDALVGLFIIAGLISLFGFAMNLRQRNADRLADQRRAFNTASLVLAGLQASPQTQIPSEPDSRVSIQRSGKRVGDLEWVEVTAIYAGRHVSIVGLAKTVVPGATP